ncbi:methylthioribulose-1- phosphate dehydratase MtnB [methanogenic archaeon mixed culture ISO4-G1]|nr:methylthioribulose-1- phosphate dehydratase MtnB [methanogenic archaeon mixed culture ISO4-G1]
MNERYARGELVKICKMLYDRQLTVSAGGNMSVRINDSEILITPSGRNKGLLEPEDLVLIDSKGKVLSDGKPSIEHKFHLALYNMNYDTNAVVHCHPLHCVTLAVKAENIKSNITPEGVLLLGEVPMIGYYTPGSKKLVAAVAAVGDHKAILMERHGAITQGRTLEEAYNRMEELEFQAKLQLMCGDVTDLPKAEIKKLSKM